jgi:hypothetical protein
VVPFMIGMHCFGHRTNLVVFILFMLSLVVHLEALLGPCMSFFSLIKEVPWISKLVWCTHRKGKQIVKKHENKMDQHVVSCEMCYGAISTFDCKNAW